MTSAELIDKLRSVDPSGQATVTIHNADIGQFDAVTSVTISGDGMVFSEWQSSGEDVNDLRNGMPKKFIILWQ